MWDLYNQQPIKMRHPAGVDVSVAAVSPMANGVGWWSADYLLAAELPGGMIGASGFPLNPIDGKPEWDQASNSWILRAKDGSGWDYRFMLPDSKMQEQWEQFKQYIDPIEALHKIAAEQEGN